MMFKAEDIFAGMRVSKRDGSLIVRVCKMEGVGFVPITESNWTLWPMPISAQGVAQVLNDSDMVIYEPTNT